ncbi:PREDICTED: uncharacterized protein LOC108370096 [Rhagoletis zephyria]|uniref:uncharacterized protein LOC108370096 n=1 Tax=Rhagoletis zephyria TaxID=28612 RepID=UPI0008115684|nr:PREDICTED: uncharacterized protein LOC108370096 [Rhagoletis zephyria]
MRGFCAVRKDFDSACVRAFGKIQFIYKSLQLLLLCGQHRHTHTHTHVDIQIKNINKQMGLTYKALKYRDIKMNMTKAKAVDDGDNNGGTDVESSNQPASAVVSSEACTPLMDATPAATDKTQNFTAEHIMQLCLFLAEKSRAKQLQQNQEMNARRYYENFLREANEFVEDEQMPADYEYTTSHNAIQSISNECKSAQIKYNNNNSTSLQVSSRTGRQTNLKSETFSTHTVLTDKCITMSSNTLPNSNLLPEVYEKLAQNSHNYQQPQQAQQQHQDKRDILLKIRQQIFERKRLRQVLSGGGQLEHSQQYLQPQYHHQQPVDPQSDYSSAELERQAELQQMGDVWRPW